jgi:hypothetical protein
VNGGPEKWSEPVRALQPREVTGQTPGLPRGTPFYIETEFRDIRGARWRLRNDRSISGGVTLKRLRRGKFDRWRLDPNS